LLWQPNPVKNKNNRILHPFVLFLTLLLATGSFGQVQKGRVVINEYMPWTLNGCGATAEFIELLNFGPGPIDIGCYIVTDGDYSITIPPNTILQPGQFYVLAGQSFIPTPCANIDSNITADLNWTTCGCTSGPVPTTGDGLFTDGGGGGEQLVLLDPNLKIVDAVVRDLPTEPSALITTSSVGGNCIPQIFDLDDMVIDYEILGMSTGRGNSFARKLDGDCGWVKDPQQSGHATNNTPNETSDVTYELTLLTPMSCNTDGAIAINVVGGVVSEIFPMNYTIVHDENNNGIIDFDDQYLSGIDSTPRIIYVNNMGPGTYRITVSSLQGCNLKTFNFTILPCYPLLPVKLVYFKAIKSTSQAHSFEWLLNETENLQTVTLEKSTDGISFINEFIFNSKNNTGSKLYKQDAINEQRFSFYRLRIVGKDGKTFFSPVINTKNPFSYYTNSVWPNPVTNTAMISLVSDCSEIANYKLFNASNSLVMSGRLSLKLGMNSFPLPFQELPTGLYHLFIIKNNQRQPISFRIVKQ